MNTHTITLTEREKIGRIERVVEVNYEIPSQILCEEDGFLMEYSSYHNSYECTNKNCKNCISGKDFVLQELEKNRESQKTKAERIVDEFRKTFRAMTYEEREDYLKEFGFSFGTPDEESK